MNLSGLGYLVIGAVIYWLFNGNPHLVDAIPFLAIMVFWPIYLFAKIAFWIAGVILFFIFAFLAIWLVFGRGK